MINQEELVSELKANIDQDLKERQKSIDGLTIGLKTTLGNGYRTFCDGIKIKF